MASRFRLLVLAGATYVGTAFILLSRGNLLLPIVVPLTTGALGTAVAWWIRRRRPAYPDFGGQLSARRH